MDSFNSADPSGVRSWLLRAFFISILFHFALFAFFYVTKLERFSPYTERLVPRVFNASRVEIDPQLLESEQPDPSTKHTPTDLSRIDIPDEPKPFEKLMDEMRATPAAPELAKPIVSEKPRVDATNLQALAKTNSAGSIDNEIDAVRDQLIHDKPAVPNRSLLDLSNAAKKSALDHGDTSGTNATTAGFSNLDQLLGQAGGVKGGTAPILMPTDLLFDYDHAELRPGAVTSLQKLGKLIQRSPNAVFGIEGHSDSFGTPEYNQQLSQLRAESVKMWLVQNMGIDPAKITTRGFGSTKLIAPATASVEEQQINRRVEIVIHASR